MAIDFMELGTAAAVLGLGAWNGVKEYNERRKSRKYDLPSNPDRCKDHEDRLRTVERGVGEIKTDVAVLRAKVDDIGFDVKALQKE